jgi:alcohol dehydrogenase class IV
LPHSFAYNSPAIEKTIRRKLAGVLPDSDGDAVQGLNTLLRRLKFEGKGLREYGMREEDVTKAAAIAVEKPYANPRTVEQSKIQELFRRAWAGEHARADL